MNQIFILLGRWGIVPLLRGGGSPPTEKQIGNQGGGWSWGFCIL